MKKKIYIWGKCLPVLLMLCFLLLFPAKSASAARKGLLLWANALVPVLFPASVLSGLLIAFDGIPLVTGLFYPAAHRLLGCSREGVFCLLTGFLCGYPMGAKTIGDLLREKRISLEEAAFLLRFCNNASPAFLIGYCLNEMLHCPKLLGPALFSVYAAPLLLAFFTGRGRRFCSVPSTFTERKTSGFQSSFKIADACMMNGLESILKLGCYILLFSVLTELVQAIPCPVPLVTYLSVGWMEMTNGIALVCADPLMSPAQKYLFTLAFVSFGGLSGAAQTAGMLSGSGLKLSPYLKAKAVTTVLTCLLAFLLLNC